MKQEKKTLKAISTWIGLWVVIFLPSPCFAAEWSAEPSISLREEYNDNAQLTTLPHNSVWNTVITPAVNFSRETDTDVLSAKARLSARRFSGNEITDRNDQYYTVSGSRNSERNQWGLDASLSRDSAGTVVLNQRDYVTINPSWVVSLDEKNSVRVDYQYAKSKYLDANNTSLTGYNNRGFSINWRYLFSERDEVSASAYTSYYTTSSGNRKSKTSGVQAQVKHKFSESLVGLASFGRRATKTTVNERQCVNGYIVNFFGSAMWSCDLAVFGLPGTWQNVDKADTDSGSVVTLSLNQNTETSWMDAEFKRDVSPSGTGYLVETDSVNISGEKKLTHNLALQLYFYQKDERYLGNVSSGNNNRYYRVNPALNWRMTEWWMLDAGYSHANQKFKAATSSASANAVYVNFTYNWPKISVSR